MKNRSWKTTSAGILLIVSGLTGFYFAWKSGNINEASITGCATSVVSGIGLCLAKDGDKTGLPTDKTTTDGIN